MNEQNKYPKFFRFLHWITFILIVFLFISGLGMDDYPFNEENFFRYKRHALMGMSVLFLTLIRIAYKYKNKDRFPPDIKYYSPLHEKLVKAVHFLMYVLMILVPIVGFYAIYQTGALAYDFGGPFPTGAELNHDLLEIHEFLVFTLGALIVMHVGGVIMYKIKYGENLIQRMI